MKVVEQIVSDLLSMIQREQLKSGDKLPSERKLCEQLNVSRTSLREALQTLNSLGIITSRTGSGNYIRDVNQLLPIPLKNQNLVEERLAQTIEPLLKADPLYRLDVQEARIILEGGTAWYAAQRATKTDLETIRHHYDELTHYQAIGDTINAATADANFHLAIAQASHNLVLIQMMQNVFHLLQHNVVSARRKIYTKAYDFDTLHAQHLAVLEAIEQRNPELARRSVCQHIEFVIQQVNHIDAAEARVRRSHRLAGTP